MVASSALSLMEELFQVTQLNTYKDIIDPVMPDLGISEKLFKSSSHSEKYELGTCLTYKVSKIK